MDIQTALNNYKSLGDFFAPDYLRDNAVLNSFKRDNPTLSEEHTTQLCEILRRNNDIIDKYFVADLLYLYVRFDEELLEPLLITAINLNDPSFNRIFLRPCIKAFGSKAVADYLAERFRESEVEERIGISCLVYWLHPQENGEADNLHNTILQHANATENLIERYYYKLRYSDRIRDSDSIPNNADELMVAIRGNTEYENFLFDKLNWRKR